MRKTLETKDFWKGPKGNLLRDHFYENEPVAIPFSGFSKKAKKLASPLFLTLLSFCGPLQLDAETYTVNSPSDSNVPPPPGTVNLRSAILSANGDTGAPTINFDFPNTGYLITLDASLPLITTDNLTIDRSRTTLAIQGQSIGTGAVTFNGGTLDLLGNETYTNTIKLPTSQYGFIQSASGTTNTLSGPILGDSTTELIFDPAGTLVVPGNVGTNFQGNTYFNSGIVQTSGTTDPFGTGTIILNGGTLDLAGNAIFANALMVEANSTIQANGTSNTLSGAISSSSSSDVLTIAGSSNLIIPGTHTSGFKGTMNLKSGTVKTSGTNPLGVGTVEFGGGTLSLQATSSFSNTILSTGTTSSLSLPASTDTASFTGAWTGTGALTFSGPGFMDVTANASTTWSGTGPFQQTGGTVQLSGTNPLGTVPYTFTSGSGIELTGNTTLPNALTLSSVMPIQNDGGTSTISGVVTSTSGLTLTGTGTLTLSANNASTYTAGTTTLTGGTLKVSSPNNIGGTNVNVKFNGGNLELSGTGLTYTQPVNVTSNGGSLTLDSGAANTWSGVFSGSSAPLSLLGSGKLTLTGNNSLYSGGFNLGTNATTSLATLSVGSPSNLGTGPIGINGGSLDITGAGTFTNAFTVGTSGTTVDLTITPVIFSGSITTAGELDLATSGLLTLSNGITGNGNLTISGSGTVAVTSNNSYTGGTFLDSGILQTSGINPLGSGDLTFNGGDLELTNSSTLNHNVVFNSSGTITTDGTTNLITGSLIGNGGWTKAGTGTLKLTGNSSYLGPTTLDAGLLQTMGTNPLGTGVLTFNGGNLEFVGNGTYGNSSVVLTMNETLTADSGTTSTISGPISGSGTLTLMGTGTVILTGANTYVGNTFVNQGSLYVDGSSTSPTTTVALGATFGGSGTVKDLDVFGALIPGNSSTGLGTLTTGKITFEAGSTLTGVLNGNQSSTLHATGDVSINATATYDPTLNPFLPASYVVLDTTGTRTGRFLPITAGSPRFPVTISYLPQSVILTVSEVPFQDLLPAGNLQNIGVCFNELSLTPNPSLDLEGVLAILNGLSVAELASAFDQFDPSIYNSIAFSEQNVAEDIRQVYTNHSYNRLYDPAFCGDVWLSVFGSRIQQDKGGDLPAKGGYDNRISGFVVGFDRFFCQDILVGSGFSYARNRVRWNSVDAKSMIDSYTGFLGGRWLSYPFSLDVYGSYTYHQAKGSHGIFIAPSTTVPIPTNTPLAPSLLTTPIAKTVEHKGNAQTYTSHIGGLSRSPFGRKSDFFIISFANLDYLFVHQNPLVQTGGGSLDIEIQGKNADLLRPELGAGIGIWANLWSGDRFFGDFSVSYVREYRFAGESSVASFAGTDCDFKVFGLSPNQGLICPSISLGLSSTYGFDVSLVYRGSFGHHYTENEGQIEFALMF